MKKESFTAMVMGTTGGIFFAIGMCMCLLPEWDALTPGIIMGGFGLVVLLIMLIVLRRMAGKSPIRFSGKAAGTVFCGIAGALTLGVGMCMAMVWNHLVWGIVIGVAGIILLLTLIPLIKGVK